MQMATTSRLVIAGQPQHADIVATLLRDGYSDNAVTLQRARRLLWTGGVVLAGVDSAERFEVVSAAAVEREQEWLTVLRLATRPEHRRQGWGRLVIEKLCSGPLPVRVYLRETNTAGIGLARAVGFRAAGVERGQFGAVDGLRFERWP